MSVTLKPVAESVGELPVEFVDTERVAARIIELNDQYPNVVYAVLDRGLDLGGSDSLRPRDIAPLMEAAEVVIPGGCTTLLNDLEFDEHGDPRNFEQDEAAVVDSLRAIKN
ncbi:hypothetical protein [Leucobacter sp. cx-169]|uniref:hypothetical protein n=1 Tax=Leucobacter sp. cx-169 TaxID=2770549 RepID=UPI00165E59B5|nr:hypothetical protein [Leucobacter sp. cx-169]MBC9927375.1 hypothetical protein [Leucobacter sp. cx-169]